MIEEFVTYNYAIMNTLKVIEKKKKKEKGDRFFFSYLIYLNSVDFHLAVSLECLVGFTMLVR